MTNELYHYGILGQKWGVRRYQNPDGTLTPAGRERYTKKLESAGKASIVELAAFGSKRRSAFKKEHDRNVEDLKRIHRTNIKNGKPEIRVAKALVEHEPSEEEYRNVSEALASRPDTRKKLSAVISTSEKSDKAWYNYARKIYDYESGLRDKGIDPDDLLDEYDTGLEKMANKEREAWELAKQAKFEAMDEYVKSVLNEPIDSKTRSAYYRLSGKMLDNTSPFRSSPGGEGVYSLANQAIHAVVDQSYKFFSNNKDADIYHDASDTIYDALRIVGAQKIRDLMDEAR